MRSVALAVASFVALSTVAQAQPTLTNDQILAKIAGLEQEIAALRARLQPDANNRPLTLAEASAEAKRVHHEWPTSTNTYTNTDLMRDAPQTATPPSSAATVVPPIGPNVARTDEGYWRDRMRALHAKVDDDQTLLVAATARERDLDRRLHRSVDDILYIRDRLQRASTDAQWNDAVAEVSRLKAAVVNDQRAVRTAEEEARRANVPPAWLVRVQ